MGGLYFGVGKALGSLFGGLLIEAIGERNTFRCFSALSLSAGFAYFLFTLILENRMKGSVDIKETPSVEHNGEVTMEPVRKEGTTVVNCQEVAKELKSDDSEQGGSLWFLLNEYLSVPEML